MGALNKQTIENLAQEMQSETTLNAVSIAFGVIESAMEDFRKNNAYVNSYELSLINDFSINAIVSSSNLDILLILNSPEMELNTKNLVKNKFKSFMFRLKYAWKNRKTKKRRRKKRKNKKDDSEELNLNRIRTKEKYNFSHFYVDFLNSISKFITNKDVVRLNNSTLTIEGESFAFTVNLFCVLEKEEAVYEWYKIDKNKFIVLDYKERYNNIENLYAHYDRNFVELCQIYNGLFNNIMTKKPSSVMIESLVANLPEKAFCHDNVLDNFIFSINYFNSLKINQLFSIADTSKKIHEDQLCNTSIIDLNNFIKKLAEICECEW